MRKIIGGLFISLDGVVQAPGGPEEDPTGGFRFGGWSVPFFDDKLGELMDTLFGQPFDLLLGRKTYEIFAAHWPYQDPEDHITKTFNKAQKYVLTHHNENLSWKGSHAVFTIDELKRIKASDGPKLVIQGSSTIYDELLKAELLDELFLMIEPVILGQGKRPFGKDTAPKTLKLIKQDLTPSGVIVAHYKVSGKVETGSFVPDQPSQEELRRRERMKKEG